jgi:sugar lactone lactonase YvrE
MNYRNSIPNLKSLLIALASILTMWAGASPVLAQGVSAQGAETVALFNPAAFETPESLQIDRRGNTYISMALTGEIRKIAPNGTQSSLAFLPIRPDVQPCGNSLGVPIMGGLALDHHGNVYASVNSCNLPDLGVWKVTREGQASLLAHLPANASPNGIAYHEGWLYVSDTVLGLVWRIHTDGTGLPEVWTADPLLSPVPLPLTPGPNGLQVFRDEVYVAVSDRAHIVAFPILEDGAAGPGRVHAAGIALDDFAFDVNGNLYGTTDPFNTLARVAPDGTVTTLLTASDGLDGPTAAAFGVGADRKNLYITNAAFPFFPGPNPRRPSLMRLNVGIPGKPRP